MKKLITAQAVKLPFTGRILPVNDDRTKPKRKSPSDKTSHAEASAEAPPKTVAPTVTPVARGAFDDSLIQEGSSDWKVV